LFAALTRNAAMSQVRRASLRGESPP
jgi:hypothetical protein